MRSWWRVGWIGALLLGPVSSAAQQPVVDTTALVAPANLGFGRQLWKPALVVGASFFLDQATRVTSQDLRSGSTNSLARMGNRFGDPHYFLPAIGVGVVGGWIFHRPGLTEWGVETAEAGGLAGAAVTVIKEIVGRPRPFQAGDPDQLKPFSGYQSFPSGHTTVAAAFATVLASRVRSPWLKGLVYGGAALTGFARINDDKHWLSDVLVGGLIGHAAGRLILHRHARKRAEHRAAAGQ